MHRRRVAVTWGGVLVLLALLAGFGQGNVAQAQLAKYTTTQQTKQTKQTKHATASSRSKIAKPYRAQYRKSMRMAKMRITPAERQKAVADSFKARQAAAKTTTKAAARATQRLLAAASAPLATPDYFGTTPNYANSPLPASVGITGDGMGAILTPTVDPGTGAGHRLHDQRRRNGLHRRHRHVHRRWRHRRDRDDHAGHSIDPVTGAITGMTVTNAGTGYNSVPGIRKFVDTLPGLGAGRREQPRPVHPGRRRRHDHLSRAPTTTRSRSCSTREKMHTDLPPTTLRGYVQIETPANAAAATRAAVLSRTATPILDAPATRSSPSTRPATWARPSSPTKDRPVRVKFTNNLPTGAGGDLFLPVDTTVMGAGMGPLGMNATPGYPMNYTQNRATLHLHGGVDPVDQRRHAAPVDHPRRREHRLSRRASASRTCPTCPTRARARMTFFYTNQQSARLMFYHDHAYGITRLNVYAGEAAGYLLQDPVEQALDRRHDGTIPRRHVRRPDPAGHPGQDLRARAPRSSPHEDPTWDTANCGRRTGNLWFPHVYMPNQNPVRHRRARTPWAAGTTAPGSGRPSPASTNGPVANPLAGTTPEEGPTIPGTPNPSLVPEGVHGHAARQRHGLPRTHGRAARPTASAS